MNLIGIGGVQPPAERAKLVAYQLGFGTNPQFLPMSAHGHPDPNTLINLGEYGATYQDTAFSKDVADYLEGGKAPGTFFRDLGGVSNQVPRWAWFVTGGVFMVLGGLAYRRHRKTKRDTRDKKRK